MNVNVFFVFVWYGIVVMILVNFLIDIFNLNVVIVCVILFV